VVVAAAPVVQPPPAVVEPPRPAVSRTVSAAEGRAAETHHQRGRELAAKGDYRAAAVALTEALTLKPDFPLALNARGFAYLQLRDYPRAVADLDEALRLNPGYANAALNRGVALRALGGRGAPAPVGVAAKAEPKPPAPQRAAQAHHQRGRELSARGDFQAAVVELTEALKLKPDFPLALNARGFAYLQLKAYKQAIADLDEAVRLEGGYSNAYFNRSAARRALGDVAGAAADLRRATTRAAE
jgi:tetratricopeptide (TPR) repeat protein